MLLSNAYFVMAEDNSIYCDLATSDVGYGAIYAGPVYDMDIYGYANFNIDFEQTGSYDIYLTCRTQHAVLDIMQDYRVVSTKEITRDYETHELAWANPTEEKIGTVNVYKTGESLIGFDVVSVDVTIGVDAVRLVRTGDAPKKLSWYATDTADFPQEAAYNRWCGGYGMYSPLAIGFTVDFEENGNYELYASLGARDATLDVNVDGELCLTYRATSDHDTDENSWLNPSEYLLGSIDIQEAGEHTIRFVVKEAHNSILFRQFRLVRTGAPNPPKILPQKIEFEDYNPGGQNVGYYDNTEGVVPAWCIDRGDDVEYGKGGSGYIVSFGVSEWMKYDVNAKKAGRYEVVVSYAMTDMSDVTVSLENGETEACTKKLYSTGDWSAYEEKSIGVVYLNEGINTLKFTMVSREMNVDYFILNPMEDTPLIETVTMNGEEISETKIAQSGADVIILTFTEDIALDENSAELYKGNTLISSECTQEGNVVTIALLESLEPSALYELRLNDITSAVDGTQMENTVFEFETNTDNTHSGSIADLKAEITDGSIKVTGTAKSSAEKGIKGRALSFCLNSEKIKDGVSGENGAFEFVYEIPSDVSTKQYEIEISTGYTKGNASILYVSDSMKAEIAGFFTETATKEDVKSACESYCDELNLNYTDEIKNVADEDEFHEYFLEKEYKNEDDVISVYNVALALGMIQAAENTEDVNKILSNDRFVKPFNITENYYVSDRTQMLSEIFEARNSCYSELEKTVKEVVRKAYLSELGKEDVFTVSQKSEFDNDEMVVFDIGYTKEITDASKVTFFYECDDLDSFEDLSVEALEGVSSKVTQEGKTLEIEFTFEGAIKEFGKLKFSAEKGTYSLKEKSEIVYTKQGYQYDAIGISKEKTIEFSVEAPKKSGGQSGGVSSSGEGMSTGKGNHIANNSENQQGESEKTGFKDLDKALWAEDYVLSLYDKGVISMAEDGNFRPNDYVTREEFLKMLVMSFELYDETAEASFLDVSKDSWYYPYVASGYKCGIILGNDENRFDTGKHITREDISVMISRILFSLGYKADSTETFADDNKISSYAKESVALVKYLGIVNGMGDMTFAPKDNTTRAQAAKVICKAMEVTGR